mmetsp:Transcript_1896/g.4304  ORF Transcript_1896/g.4304 Transcript_1896/m.4304 type:complete len:362 (+) Transcript_1896:162-1247(+)
MPPPLESPRIVSLGEKVISLRNQREQEQAPPQQPEPPRAQERPMTKARPTLTPMTPSGSSLRAPDIFTPSGGGYGGDGQSATFQRGSQDVMTKSRASRPGALQFEERRTVPWETKNQMPASPLFAPEVSNKMVLICSVSGRKESDPIKASDCPVMIGREPGPLGVGTGSDTTVSQRHAEFFFRPGQGFALRALSNTNRCFVIYPDGREVALECQSVSPTLKPGCKIRLGRDTLVTIVHIGTEGVEFPARIVVPAPRMGMEGTRRLAKCAQKLKFLSGPTGVHKHKDEVATLYRLLDSLLVRANSGGHVPEGTDQKAEDAVTVAIELGETGSRNPFALSRREAVEQRYIQVKDALFQCYAPK